MILKYLFFSSPRLTLGRKTHGELEAGQVRKKRAWSGAKHGRKASREPPKWCKGDLTSHGYPILSHTL